MATDDVWQARTWLADLTGVVTGLAALAVIGFFLGIKAHAIAPASGGFWIF